MDELVVPLAVLLDLLVLHLEPDELCRLDGAVEDELGLVGEHPEAAVESFQQDLGVGLDCLVGSELGDFVDVVDHGLLNHLDLVHVRLLYGEGGIGDRFHVLECLQHDVSHVLQGLLLHGCGCVLQLLDGSIEFGESRGLGTARRTCSSLGGACECLQS